MSSIEKSHAEVYADSLADSIETVMLAVDGEMPIDGQDPREYLEEWPLEIVSQRGRRFEVVLAVGGPDARVVCDLDSDGQRWGSAKLEVSWGGNEGLGFSRSIDALADYFADLYAELGV